MGMLWKNLERPGFTRDDTHVLAARTRDDEYGKGHWRVAHVAHGESLLIDDAIRRFYEVSYYRWLAPQPILVDKLCSYRDVMIAGHDVAHDYTGRSLGACWRGDLHDIALRRVVAQLGRRFTGTLQLSLSCAGAPPIVTPTSADLDARWFNPGFVPFYDQRAITGPSMRPPYTIAGSLADFWISNRWLQIRVADAIPQEAV